MPKITFATNVAQQVRLQSLEGELTPSQYGGNQIKFSAVEGPFWVSEAVGSILMDQIRKKHIQAGIPVEICKQEIAQGNGRKGIAWRIDAVGFAPGEQSDGTFAVTAPTATPLEQQLRASIERATARAIGPEAAAVPWHPDSQGANGKSGNGSNNNGHSSSDNGWAAYIAQLTQARIELYVGLCKWAVERYGGSVSKQEVSSFLMNVLISCDKNGGAK